MSRGRALILGLAAVLLAAAGVGYAFRGDIALAIWKRGVARALTTDAIAGLAEGLHVALCRWAMNTPRLWASKIPEVD
jgi:hypothetical protein